ncbi:hypothetical protein GC207_15490, partial [bacterium]|nr:hypothetical protein [bacterium]
MASLTTAGATSTAALSTGSEHLLKTDALGRLRITPEHRQALLKEFERSGVSAAQFAQLAGLKYSTFAAWVNRQRRARKAPARGSRTGLRLVEALVAPAKGGKDSGAALILRLPGGVSLELSAPDQVPLAVSFIQALAGRC